MQNNNQDLLNLLKLKEEEKEPIMSEMAAADYEQMQSPIIPNNTPQEQVFSAPKLEDVLPPKQQPEMDQTQQPQVPMVADASEEMAPKKPETEMERLERMLSEARKSDRTLKIGGAIGDALATYINARSQMKAKVPGVQVQQGAGLGKIAEMFATAPEIESDVKTRREALLKQYAELARDQRAKARLDSAKEVAAERNKALLEAARIRAGAAGAEKPLTSYQQYMIGKSEKKEAKLSDKQTSELEGLGNVMRSLDEVELAKSGVNTGKYASTYQSGREALPFSEAEQDFVKLRQLSGTQLFDYVKTQSGVSYSVKELEQLKSNMPNVEDDDNTFITKLNTVREIVKRKQQEKFKALEGQGKDISRFKQEQSEETKPHPVTGKMLRKVPGGWEEVD